ncbi:hypothetical protein bcf_27950 (plasmid) [Bacillus cereus F837/76]|nr:hypothetical protein bcf_27950 [Bacillus cereus F837/76]
MVVGYEPKYSELKLKKISPPVSSSLFLPAKVDAKFEKEDAVAKVIKVKEC